LRDQLKRLEELQQHDAKIQELENVLKAIPAKLEGTRTDLLRVEAILKAEQTQLAETERYYGDQKHTLDDELVQVSESKQKLGKSTNAKEYAAAQRETEQRREDATNREAEITKLVEAIRTRRRSSKSGRATSTACERLSRKTARSPMRRSRSFAGRSMRCGLNATSSPKTCGRTCSSATATSACAADSPW